MHATRCWIARHSSVSPDDDELKRGHASDVVVGQILRYMAYIKKQMTESEQIVEGVIIALENDQKSAGRYRQCLTQALSYRVSFRLVTGQP